MKNMNMKIFSNDKHNEINWITKYVTKKWNKYPYDDLK